MNFPTFKWGELFHKEKLGQGAFGKVYKAECLSFLQPVAVKKLECRSAHEERLFIKEVKLFFHASMITSLRHWQCAALLVLLCWSLWNFLSCRMAKTKLLTPSKICCPIVTKNST